MTVIGEFRYVNHYFKIYEDGEIYVDYKPLGKVYADGKRATCSQTEGSNTGKQ